jgi:hypothetical protein
MIWSLSIKFEKLEPPNTRKSPRVNAQESRLGPIQPRDVKDFFGERVRGAGSSVAAHRFGRGSRLMECNLTNYAAFAALAYLVIALALPLFAP